MRVEYFAQMAIGDMKPKGSTEILLASLAEEGLKPEDIDTVIYTHLHYDHVGNADLFPDAVTYVQKAEYDNMLSPYPFPKARMDYFPDTPERLSKVKRLLLVDGDLKLANGLELYLTPGHSRGGQTIVVPTEKGRYVITGDNSATKYCLFADMDKMTLMDGTSPDRTLYDRPLCLLRQREEAAGPGGEAGARVFPALSRYRDGLSPTLRLSKGG